MNRAYTKGMHMEEKQGIRLNKFLSSVGVCSRREADKLIEAKKVTIDGRVAITGEHIFPTQKICINGKPIKKETDRILIVLNKPKGIVCTTSKKDKNNIVDYLGFDKRIYPIGRLDKDSEGLILLTNQGELVDKILRGSNYHEKEYIVEVNKNLTEDFLQKMRNGVPILDTMTRPCQVEQIGRKSFQIILTQGLNRQIRRMCEALDYRVIQLKRIRIMNIRLGKLKTGSYRNITEEEFRQLKKLLE